MSRTIMSVMQENVNPVSVSNSIYEMMLDWRNCSIRLRMDPTAKHKGRLKIERNIIERSLARFFGVGRREMRTMLREHFDLGANDE
jgi:hypothetical protein